VSTRGLFGKVELEGRELRYKRRYKQRVKGSKRGSVVTMTKGTEKLFKQIPVELRLRVLKQATRASGNIVARQAAANARPHQSKRTGTRKLWSRKIKNQRENNPKNLAQSLRTKVIVYRNAVLAITGPERPWGNIGNVFEFGGMIPRWNKDGNSTRTRQPPRPFLRAAADVTTHKRKRVFILAVKKRFKNL